MNQTCSVEKYIESRVIGRLEHMMDGGGMYDGTPWYSCTWEQENNIKRDPEYGCILHKKMLPYYGMYLNSAQEDVTLLWNVPQWRHSPVQKEHGEHPAVHEKCD